MEICGHKPSIDAPGRAIIACLLLPVGAPDGTPDALDCPAVSLNRMAGLDCLVGVVYTIEKIELLSF
jgi:hypothetical protein